MRGAFRIGTAVAFATTTTTSCLLWNNSNNNSKNSTGRTSSSSTTVTNASAAASAFRRAHRDVGRPPIRFLSPFTSPRVVLAESKTTTSTSKGSTPSKEVDEDEDDEGLELDVVVGWAKAAAATGQVDDQLADLLDYYVQINDADVDEDDVMIAHELAMSGFIPALLQVLQRVDAKAADCGPVCQSPIPALTLAALYRMTTLARETAVPAIVGTAKSGTLQTLMRLGDKNLQYRTFVCGIFYELSLMLHTDEEEYREAARRAFTPDVAKFMMMIASQTLAMIVQKKEPMEHNVMTTIIALSTISSMCRDDHARAAVLDQGGLDFFVKLVQHQHKTQVGGATVGDLIIEGLGFLLSDGRSAKKIAAKDMEQIKRSLQDLSERPEPTGTEAKEILKALR